MATNGVTKAHINTIPNELLSPIVNLLSKIGAVCLGVTCRHQYNYFKVQNPERIQIGFSDYRCYLCENCAAGWILCDPPTSYHGWNRSPDWRRFTKQLVETWKGPTHHFGHAPFSEEDFDRFLRDAIWSDYVYSTRWVITPTLLPDPEVIGPRYHKVFDWLYISYNRCPGNWFKMPPSLPSPYRNRTNWYSAALDAILDDYFKDEDIHQWRRYWSGTVVFRENREFFDNFRRNLDFWDASEKFGKGVQAELAILGL